MYVKIVNKLLIFIRMNINIIFFNTLANFSKRIMNLSKIKKKIGIYIYSRNSVFSLNNNGEVVIQK